MDKATRLITLENLSRRCTEESDVALLEFDEYHQRQEKDKAEEDRLYKVYEDLTNRATQAKSRWEDAIKESDQQYKGVSEKLQEQKKWRELGLPPLKWKAEPNMPPPRFTTAEEVLDEAEFMVMRVLKDTKQLDDNFGSFIQQMLQREQDTWFRVTYKTVSGYDANKPSWTHFRQAFINKFDPSKILCEEYQNLMDLVMIKMLPEIETLDEFNARFNKVWKKGRENDGVYPDGEVLAHIYVNSLPDELKRTILKHLLSINQQGDGVQSDSTTTGGDD
jgi:hypothetical protein